MNTYAVEQYFEMKPDQKKVYETPDGVLHATKAVAEKWVKRHSNKAIITHENPAFAVKVEGLESADKEPETETEEQKQMRLDQFTNNLQ